jgi:hypothetical protein
MRLFAFAALLALPLLGFGAGSASADYYCCGQQKSYEHHGSGHYGRSSHYEHTKLYYVNKHTAVFDCDAYHCETKIKIEKGATVEAHCRHYGWCEIKGGPFKHLWVVETCLEPHYGRDEGYGGGDDYGDEGNDYRR